MAFHIRDKETDALVRELARKEKVGVTDAVKDKLKTLDAKPSLHDQLREIAGEIAHAPKTGKKADKKFFDALSGQR